jgi:hypothetical protein
MAGIVATAVRSRQTVSASTTQAVHSIKGRRLASTAREHHARRCNPGDMTTADRRHQKVLWHHDLPDEPVELYSEISSGYEIRKVETFRNGRHDYADRSCSTGTTMLGEIPVPHADEISQDPEFSATEITATEFEHIWLRATRT